MRWLTPSSRHASRRSFSSPPGSRRTSGPGWTRSAHQADGAAGTVTVTLSAPEDAAFAEFYLWGPAGRSVAPTETGHPVTALRTALAELAANARSGRIDHPCDARFGREV